MVFCYQNCSDLATLRKKCSSDREKLLKFKAEGREFAISLRSLEQSSERPKFGIGIGSVLGFPLSRDFSNFQVPGLLDFFSPGTMGPRDLQGL